MLPFHYLFIVSFGVLLEEGHVRHFDSTPAQINEAKFDNSRVTFKEVRLKQISQQGI
jgi:hypothetical protein